MQPGAQADRSPSIRRPRSPAATQRRGIEREAAGKGRQASARYALGLGQQPIAPVERRAQCLLARQRRADSAGEQPEAVVQRALICSIDSERTRAAASSSASGMPSRWMQSSPRAGACAARQGEVAAVAAAPDRRTAAPLPSRAIASAVACGSGSDSVGQWIDLLAIDLQWLAAGGDDRRFEPRAGSIAPASRGTRFEHVLAVVEHEQQLPRP